MRPRTRSRASWGYRGDNGARKRVYTPEYGTAPPPITMSPTPPEYAQSTTQSTTQSTVQSECCTASPPIEYVGVHAKYMRSTQRVREEYEYENCPQLRLGLLVSAFTFFSSFMDGTPPPFLLRRRLRPTLFLQLLNVGVAVGHCRIFFRLSAWAGVFFVRLRLAPASSKLQRDGREGGCGGCAT